jgi:hypothetical protein
MCCSLCWAACIADSLRVYHAAWQSEGSQFHPGLSPGKILPECSECKQFHIQPPSEFTGCLEKAQKSCKSQVSMVTCSGHKASPRPRLSNNLSHSLSRADVVSNMHNVSHWELLINTCRASLFLSTEGQKNLLWPSKQAAEENWGYSVMIQISKHRFCLRCLNNSKLLPPQPGQDNQAVVDDFWVGGDGVGGRRQASREKLPFRIYDFGSQECRRDSLANTLGNCLGSPLHFAVCRPARVQTCRT